MFTGIVSFPINLNVVNGQITAAISDGSDTGTLIGGNLFIGGNAGNQTLAGNRNVGVGQNALNDLQGLLGSGNTALGFRAGPLLNAGSGNVLVGSLVAPMLSNTAGRSSNNTVVGSSTAMRAMYLLNTTILGEGAGSAQTGYSACTLIGANADCTVNNLYNATALGYNASCNISNTMVLGNGQVCVGISQNSPAYVLDLGNITFPGPNAAQCGVRYASSSLIPATPTNTNDIVIFNNAGTPYWLDTSGGLHPFGSGGGSVTSISAGTGITLTPNPITTTGTVAITSTAVTAGTYSFPINMAVNAQGQITAITSDGLDDGSNVIIGSSTASSFSGHQNAAFGHSALAAGGSTTNNVAAGYGAMGALSTGGGNVAIGLNALRFNTSVSGTVVVGTSSYVLVTSPSGSDTILGSNIGGNVTTSGLNVLIGANVATTVGITTLNNCTLVGTNSTLGNNNLSNAGAFGYNTTINVSNGIVLGHAAYVGVNQSSPAYSMDLANVSSQCALRLAASTGTPTTPANTNDLLIWNNAGTFQPMNTSGTLGNAAFGTISSGTWNGSVIGLAYGGTNANLTANNGGIFYSTASAGAILAGTATARQLLLSGATAAPTWSTTTYPTTNAINTLLYASAANVMSALATANNAVLTTGTTGAPVLTALTANGQIIIGATSGAPAAATLTAGSGVTITNAANSITIAATGTGGTVTSLAQGTGITLSPDPILTIGTIALTVPVAVTSGGTGQTSYTNGQLLIGNTTGNTLALSTLTAGSGVTIANGAGSITISATGTGGTVTSVSGTTNQINVATGTTTPVLSLSSTIVAPGTLAINDTSTTAFVVANNSAATTYFKVDTSTPQITASCNTTITGLNGVTISGGFSSSFSSLVLNGSAYPGGSGGTVTIQGGGSSTSTSNTVNVYGSGSNGGTVNVYGGISGTSSGNLLNLYGGFTAGGTVTIQGGNGGNGGTLTLDGGTSSTPANNIINFHSSGASGVHNFYGNTTVTANGAVSLYGSNSSGTVGALNLYGSNSSSSGTVTILGAAATGGNAGAVNIYGNNSSSGTNSSVTIYANSAGTAGTVTIQAGNSSSQSNNVVNIIGGGSNGGYINIGTSSGGNPMRFYASNTGSRTLDFTTISSQSIYLDGYGNIHGNSTNAGTNWNATDGSGNAVFGVNIAGANAGSASFLFGGNSTSNATTLNLYGNNANYGGTLVFRGGGSSTLASNIITLGPSTSAPQTVTLYGTLNVQGTTSTTFYVQSNSGTSNFYVDTTNSRIWNNVDTVFNSSCRPVSDNAISCATSGNRWTTIYAVSGTVNTSALDQKANVKDSTLGLDFINKLKPKSWQWIDGPDTTKEHHGLVFEDVAAVAPANFGALYPGEEDAKKFIGDEEVLTGKKVPHGITYHTFIAPLINAIQELSAKVAALEAKQGVAA